MAAPRVLIVDDEAPLVSLLSQTLTNERYQVLTARDGVDCMNKVAAFRPDVIVLDIMMPKLDGLDTTRLIRRNRAYAETMIIALSARADPQTRETILAAGANHFMRKPFTIARLVDLISRALVARPRPAV
jgi:CheY-like chemotaxis protein